MVLPQSPGSLYIGGQALKLTAIPERIFDLYTQSHVPNDTPNANPLKLHAIVSQNLKVPIALSDNLAERLHNRTVTEENERLKRGLVRIDSPAPQPGAKKRKLDLGAQSRPSAGIAGARVGNATARPANPSTVKTLAGPPLSAQSLARQAVKHKPSVASSASDTSSSSSQPLASQPPLPRSSTIHPLASTETDPVKQPSSKVKHPVPEVKATSAIPTPASINPASSQDTARDSTEGWKTSSFKGGVRTKSLTKAGTTKGAGNGTTSKAKTIKSNPIITDDLDDLIVSSTSSSRNATATATLTSVETAPVAKGSRPGGGTAKVGTKRPREPLPSTPAYDASHADADLLAAAEVPVRKRSTAPAVGLEAELDAAAAVTSKGVGRVGNKSALLNGSSSSSATTKKSRLSNLDDVLLDAVSASPAPSVSGAGVSSTTKPKIKVKPPKPNYDDEDWDSRGERRPPKKTPTTKGSSSTLSQPSSVNVNAKPRKASALASDSGGRGVVSSVRANGSTTSSTGVNSKQRSLAENNTHAATDSIPNGAAKVSNGVKTTISGSSRNVSSGINNAASTQRLSSGAKKLKGTSHLYSSDEDDDPPPKIIPNVPKARPDYLKPSSNTSIGPVPPSPVSLTAASSKSMSTKHTRSSATTTTNTSAGPDAAVSSPMKKRKRLETEDRNIDALLNTPLPRSREALREHYDSCYVTYIGLWGRIRAETRRQMKLLRRSTGSDGDGGDDASSVDGGNGSGGENAEALKTRYGRLHERLQNIRNSLGA